MRVETRGELVMDGMAMFQEKYNLFSFEALEF
jgi:hypothetical protein